MRGQSYSCILVLDEEAAYKFLSKMRGQSYSCILVLDEEAAYKFLSKMRGQSYSCISWMVLGGEATYTRHQCAFLSQDAWPIVQLYFLAGVRQDGRLHQCEF